MSLEIVQGCRADAIDRITDLHGAYYRKYAGFGAYFESRVASELAGFVCRYDGTRDGMWLALAEGLIEGAIVIDGIDAGGAGAHLRWFVVSDAERGNGLGNLLIRAALAFCRANAFSKVYLNTIAGLDAARHLYEKVGFSMVSQRYGNQWGVEAREQRFECRLPG